MLWLTCLFCFRQVDLEEERLKKQNAALSLWRKIALYSVRVLMFLVSLGLIVATFFAIARATEFSQVNSVKPASWVLNVKSIGLSFLSNLCPIAKQFSGRDPGFGLWVSALHCHHRRELLGASAVWPNRFTRKISSQRYCDNSFIEVCTVSSFRCDNENR